MRAITDQWDFILQTPKMVASGLGHSRWDASNCGYGLHMMRPAKEAKGIIRRAGQGKLVNVDESVSVDGM